MRSQLPGQNGNSSRCLLWGVWEGGEIMDWSSSGKKTSLICNFCKKPIKIGEKVYWPDDESRDVIVHQSHIRGNKK